MLINDRNKQQSGDRFMLGSLKIDPLMYLYLPILFCTPLYTYHMAVSHKQQKPFPWATVTQTACHYPQDIVFRFTMGIASSIIALSFFIIFRWLENQCTRVGHRSLSKWYFYVTQFSMICYSITIGTIDENGTGKLHGACAVIFFVVWFAVIIRITSFISELRHWDSSVISRKSMLLKKALAFYIVSVWLYCIYGLLTTPNDNQKKSDQFVVIVEWNSVLGNLLWVLTFVLEWKELNFCLDYFPKKQSARQQNHQYIGTEPNRVCNFSQDVKNMRNIECYQPRFQNMQFPNQIKSQNSM